MSDRKAIAHAAWCEAGRELIGHLMDVDGSMEFIQEYRREHGRAKNGSLALHRSLEDGAKMAGKQYQYAYEELVEAENEDGVKMVGGQHQEAYEAPIEAQSRGDISDTSSLSSMDETETEAVADLTQSPDNATADEAARKESSDVEMDGPEAELTLRADPASGVGDKAVTPNVDAPGDIDMSEEGTNLLPAPAVESMPIAVSVDKGEEATQPPPVPAVECMSVTPSIDASGDIDMGPAPVVESMSIMVPGDKGEEATQLPVPVVEYMAATPNIDAWGEQAMGDAVPASGGKAVAGDVDMDENAINPLPVPVVEGIAVTPSRIDPLGEHAKGDEDAKPSLAPENVDTAPPGVEIIPTRQSGEVDTPQPLASEVEAGSFVFGEVGNNALGDLAVEKRPSPRAHPSAERQHSSEHDSPPSGKRYDPIAMDIAGRDSGLYKMEEMDEIEDLGESKRPAICNPQSKIKEKVTGKMGDAVEKRAKAKKSEQELQDLEEKGLAAIAKFVADPGNRIDPTIRRTAREVQDFLPEAATTSREVAIHFLSATQDSVNCIYHCHSDKDFKAREKPPSDGPYSFTGVTGVFRKKGDPGAPSPGHLRCGCEIESALMYFIFWKTWTLRGPGDMEEGMSPSQMNPRARNLVTQAMQKATGINSGNVYPKDVAYASLEHQRYLRRVQLCHVVEELKRINRAMGLEPLTSEDMALLMNANNGRAPPSM